MGWEIKTEAPKVETPEAKAARETKEFGDNLKKVTAELKDTKKDPEKIASLLDTKFQEWLKKLSTGTESDKKQLADLKSLVESVQTDKTITLDDKDKAALTSLLALIAPLTTTYTAEVITHNDEFKSTKVVEETDQTKFDSYNQNSDNLKAAKNKIILPEYNNLPWKKLIEIALNSPTKTNIQELQGFLYTKVNNTDKNQTKDLLKTKSFNKVTGARDWRLGEKTFAAFDQYLTTFAGEVTTAKTEAQKTLDAKKIADESTANTVVTTTEKIKSNAETILDNQAALAIVNSKITYAHPERADKAIKVADDMKTISYRGAVFNIPPKTLVTINNAKTTWWMSFKPENFITLLDPTESKSFTDRKAEKDKEVDAKIMTYDANTNSYVYGWKYISRDAIGTGADQMTLETFQTEVDKMNMNNNNESATTTKRISADGSVITKIKDFQYGNGYKIKTSTLDDKMQNVATTKVEVKRGDKEKTVTKTFDAQGRTDTFTKVKTNGDVKKEKIRTFDDEWRVIDFTKNIEKKDSFKERATTKEMDIDNKTTDVIPASAADISKALNDISKKTPLIIPMPINGVPVTVNVPTNSLFNNYDIKNSGEKINISLKKEWTPLSKTDFDAMFKTLLTDAGITKLAMKEYNEQGSKTEKDNVTTKSVTERSFTVNEGTSQNKPASQKIIAGDQKWTIPNNLA